MASSLESTYKKIKDTSQEFGKNIYDHISIEKTASPTVKNILNDNDLRQYEQLVIMKKYPYLDMKELEMKLSPSNKNVRHNIHLHQGPNNENEPSLNEPNEDSINVEVVNRGLSGVAIPTKLAFNLEQKRVNLTNLHDISSENLILSLKNDINEYIRHKNVNSRIIGNQKVLHHYYK
ncbi:unnamed protein product [Leptidea sinapis]|uniref:Uncharacterized protein n=1 Tax=Leptidea sinapis TaxID=189913 RepID=A0A5E4PTA7_9NEOP|nr:unnamed protein product [Leptidea sinapis]